MAIWNRKAKGKGTGLPQINEKDQEAFKDRIKREAQEKLSPDQLRELYAERIGIDSQLLGLPGVKDVLFTFSDFEIVMNNIGFDTRVKDAKQYYTIEKIDGKDTIIFEKGIERYTVQITREESSYTIKKTKEISDILREEEERQYDLKTKIEVYRSNTVVVPSQSHSLSVRSSRDIKHLEKVYAETYRNGEFVTGIELDISKKDRDIATLDAVDGPFGNMLYNKTELHDVRSKRVLGKIALSKNAKGCYEYTGMEDPNSQAK